MERSGQVEQADAVWAQAEQVICTIKRGDERDWVLRILGEKLVASHRWESAAAVISGIERGDLRDMALQTMGGELAKTHQWERAEAVISTIERNDLRIDALRMFGEALANAQQWERAEAAVLRKWQGCGKLCVILRTERNRFHGYLQTVQMASLPSRDYLAVCPVVPAVSAQLPRSRGDDARARIPCRSHHHLPFGSILRTQTGT